jgi:hypothetical protein
LSSALATGLGGFLLLPILAVVFAFGFSEVLLSSTF